MNVTKKFTHKKALDSVSIKIMSGQIHALLGENGAGKSTLASVLSGGLDIDEGKLQIGTSPYDTESVPFKDCVFHNPKEAQNKRIVMVHQRALIPENLTVLENAVLGDPCIICFFCKKKIRKRLQNILDDWHVSLDIHKKGKDLNTTERFYAELLSALYKNPSLLILDEPTSRLPEKERSLFLKNLRKKASNGLAVLFITHNLHEALNYANYISVLKKGKMVFSKQNSKTEHIDIRDLEKAVFTIDKTQKNRAEKKRTKRKSFPNTETVFALVNVFYAGKKYPSLFDVSFSVHRGAITYIYGQKASGIQTLEEIITGIEELHFKGNVFFNNSLYYYPKKQLNPRTLRNGGASLISSNKTYRSSNPNLSIVELLSVYKKVDKKAEDAIVFSKSLIEAESMAIKPQEPVSALSGGMLQRLILERELSTDPQLLLFFEPGQGLDGQRLEQLAEQLRSLADMGKAILLVSANKHREFVTITDIEHEMQGGRLI